MRSGAFDYALEADAVGNPDVVPLRNRPAAVHTDDAVEDQENKAKLEAREASNFWRNVLTHPVGKREVFKLLQLVSAFETSPFAATPVGFPDTNATFFKAGQIAQGQAVYQMLAIVARDELFALQDERNVYGALAQRPDRKD